MKILLYCISGLALFLASGWKLPAQQVSPNRAGQVLYEQQCAACHGTNGDGNGPAAAWLYPKPRDFSAGQFKIKSTPGRSMPTDEDLLRSITRGLPGSSMPGFGYLKETELQDLVRYVKHLTAYMDDSGKRINRFEEASVTGALAQPVPVPPEPAATVQVITQGREVYERMQCSLCHGETGAGDGPQVPTLKDYTGLPAPPRDFNTGLFRRGHTGADLYLRIHNGLPGTPMIPYGSEVMTSEERWALVHYVRSLRRTDVAVSDLLMPEDGGIRVKRVAKLITDPMDRGWEQFDPVRVPLNPLWPEPKQVYAVAVTAVTDGRKLALLLHWRDDLPQHDAIRVQDFQDAAAVQFSLTGQYGFIGMGDARHPVNLWHWKAGWQAEAEGRGGPTMAEVYPSLRVDGWLPTSYNTAADAGNSLAQAHRSPIEDANAHGFGSFRPQPPAQQNVQGQGRWHDGFWNVVFLRDLKSRDRDDVQFAAGKTVPVAFAIWNGEQGDRNGRKMVSNWFQLILDDGQARTAKR